MDNIDPLKDMEEWRTDLDKALTLLESISEVTGPDERLLRVVERFERMNREAMIEAQVFKEMKACTNFGDRKPREVFEQRVNEILSKNEKVKGEAAARIEALKKNAGCEGTSKEFEVEKMFYSRKDPYTKQDIKDPVQNNICKHVYDRESVQAFIKECKKRRQLCQCPVAGCPNKETLKMSNIIPFPEFFDHVKD